MPKQASTRRTCRRCGITHPLTDEHYNRTSRGLALVCRACDQRGRPRLPKPDPVPESTPDAVQCSTCALWYAPGDMVKARCRGCHAEARAERHQRRRADAQRYAHTPEARFRTCRRIAAHRGLTWSLTLDAFRAFDGAPCAYCGTVPDGIGLDRVDSSRGYEPGNVVPCCATCNAMKGALSVAGFLEHVRRIVERAAA